MSEPLKLTSTESVTIRRSDPEVLEVEAEYGPSGRRPPKHLHPIQDEHFEVLSGRLQVRLDGSERTLTAGETIDIPRGTAHQMWNPGGEPARVLWQTRPAGRTEQWFRDIDALHRSGRVRSNGMPSPLAFGVFLREYRDIFRLAPEPPRPALALLGKIGRLRGYRAGAGS